MAGRAGEGGEPGGAGAVDGARQGGRLAGSQDLLTDISCGQHGLTWPELRAAEVTWSDHDLTLCRARAGSGVGERRDGDGGGLGLARHCHVGQRGRAGGWHPGQVDRLAWRGEIINSQAVRNTKQNTNLACCSLRSSSPS